MTADRETDNGLVAHRAKRFTNGRPKMRKRWLSDTPNYSSNDRPHFFPVDTSKFARLTSQLNSTQRASMDAGVKTPQCPHLSGHYCISIL